MTALLTLLGVACCTVAAYVLSSATTIGVLQVILAAIFGFGAFVCACVLVMLIVAKRTKNKVVNTVSKFRRKRIS